MQLLIILTRDQYLVVISTINSKPDQENEGQKSPSFSVIHLNCDLVIPVIKQAGSPALQVELPAKNA